MNLFNPYCMYYNIYCDINCMQNNCVKIKKFDLDNIKNNERVFINNSNQNQYIYVQKLNSKLQTWKTIFYKCYDKHSDTKIITGYWKEINNKVLIVVNTSKKNGFLSYTIIENKDNKYNIIDEKSQIFEGMIWIENNELFQRQGNIYSKIILTNSKLTTKQVNQPIIQNAKILEYNIMSNRKINLRRNKYNFEIGDIVQLIRTNNNNIFEKICFNDTEKIEFIKHRTAFKILDNLQFDIEIIPEYDWNNSKKIHISA